MPFILIVIVAIGAFVYLNRIKAFRLGKYYDNEKDVAVNADKLGLDAKYNISEHQVNEKYKEKKPLIQNCEYDKIRSLPELDLIKRNLLKGLEIRDQFNEWFVGKRKFKDIKF
jgi:hypothetical protein